jgi:hypothetical protein
LAWLAAIKEVDAASGHEAHNVIIDVKNPAIEITRSNPIVAAVDDFLGARNRSVFSVANTIFPFHLYQRHGAPKIFSVFPTTGFCQRFGRINAGLGAISNG